MAEYNEKETVLEGRGSFSKTDHDATFMRMKEDHMRNGQLKPAYNLQLSTNNQFILHYSLHRTPSDTVSLIEHLEGFEDAYGCMPEDLIADAGYGSEENYTFLEEKKVNSYVKYNTFDNTPKRRRRARKYPFSSDQLHYDPAKDVFICPIGQSMVNIGTCVRKTKTGFQQQVTQYQATNCNGCPLRGLCHKSKNNRIIEINHNKERLRARSRSNLESETGIAYRKQRPVDVEPVFGHLKSNRGFKRFLLRGLDKVEIETALLAIAHNLRKIAG